jgi:integrase
VASFFKDKSRGDTWTCQYSISGQKRPGVKRGFARKKDAEKWFRESGFAIEAGTIKQSEKITVAEWMRTWVESCPHIQPNTKLARKNAIEKHIIPAMGEIKLSMLRPDNARAMVSKMMETLKPSSLRQIYSYFVNAIRMAQDDGLLFRNPCSRVSLPVPEIAKPNFCTAEQAKNIITEMENSQYSMPIYLCIMLGLRRGEALGLKWSDISDGKIHIHMQVTREGKDIKYKKTKTQRSDRVQEIPKSLQERLNTHRKRQLEQKLLLGPIYHDEGFVCATPDGGVLSPNSMTSMAKRFIQRIGAAPGTHLHDLRHTYATLLYQSGCPIDVVADMLGDTIATAQKYYIGEDKSKQKEAAQKAEDLFGVK